MGADGDSELRLTALVDEFGARLRAGDAPDVDAFVARLPGREEELRELLSTVSLLEHAEPRADESTIGGMRFTQVGPYRIERELGRGGMGVVFLATDEQLGRQVALKFLPSQATLDKRFLKRFRREARAAGQLTHPHIVPVFGAGEHATLHYYAMQYVDGHGLDQVVGALLDWSEDAPAPLELAEGSLGATVVDLLQRDRSAGSDDLSGGPAPRGAAGPARERGRGRVYFDNVARLGLQVADALAYAHSHGIVHRDIKPSNLLLDADGHVWVTDFGLCTTSEADQLTMADDLVGTLRYMAPEMIDGRGDVRCDEYGLGITLYELLTLRPAFEGSDRAGLLRRVAEQHPPRPRRIDPSIPRDLEAVVLKATAKLPEDRYGSAEALARDLRAFLEGRPIAARPPSPLRLLRLAVLRNKVLAGTIAAALLVLLTLSWMYVDRLRAARADQDRNLYRASIAAAAAAMSNPELARGLLDQAPEPLRSWEWAHLDAGLDSSLAVLRGPRMDLRDFGVSPDGRVAVMVGAGVVVRELAEPAREWVIDGPIVWRLAIRPEGREAALVAAKRLSILSLEGEPEIVAERELEASEASAVCYRVDGGALFVGTRAGRIVAFAPDLERELFSLPGVHGDWVQALAVTPDGRALVSGGRDGSVLLHDLETRASRLLGGHVGRVFSVDVDPTGRLVAAGGSDGSVRLWDLRTGRELAAWHEHDEIVYSVRFFADGRRLASAGDDRRIRVWDTDELALSTVLAGHDVTPHGLAPLPDGRLLSADGNGTLREWHPGAVGGLALLRGHVADLWSLEFDARGERLVSTSRDGTVRVWDAGTGQPLRVFVLATPTFAAFAPDGATVLAGYGDGALRQWDLERGALVWEHVPAEGAPDRNARVCFAPSGERFYSLSARRGVDSWERRGAGWERTASVALRNGDKLVGSPSGRLLAVGALDGSCVLLDGESLAPRWRKTGIGAGAVFVSFSPDERWLATGSSEGKVALWNMQGELVRSFRVETTGVMRSSGIWGLGFDRAGARLVCATQNLGLTLWDPGRGILVARLVGRGRGYTLAVASPDGRRIASTAWDGLVRVWDTIPAGERLELLERAAPDGIARAHAARGTVAGLHAIARAHLRVSPSTEPDLQQGYALALGLLKEHSDDPRVRAVTGEVYYRYGKLAEAREHLLAAVEGGALAGEPSFDAQVFLAMVAASLRDRALALAAFDRARELADGSPEEVRLLAEARALVEALGG